MVLAQVAQHRHGQIHAPHLMHLSPVSLQHQSSIVLPRFCASFHVDSIPLWCRELPGRGLAKGKCDSVRKTWWEEQSRAFMFSGACVWRSGLQLTGTRLSSASITSMAVTSSSLNFSAFSIHARNDRQMGFHLRRHYYPSLCSFHRNMRKPVQSTDHANNFLPLAQSISSNRRVRVGIEHLEMHCSSNHCIFQTGCMYLPNVVRPLSQGNRKERRQEWAVNLTCLSLLAKRRAERGTAAELSSKSSLASAPDIPTSLIRRDLETTPCCTCVMRSKCHRIIKTGQVDTSEHGKFSVTGALTT